ncbi:sensor histidine kinase [Melittangium boletus]|uniref:sensor histidine kinase n=1 Tax=Melittangium boletus TaxID=83453 RepID=UPI001FEB8D31|nr:ATP-binding protein [Melittangium boletus]
MKRKLFSVCAGMLFLGWVAHCLCFGVTRPVVALALLCWSASFLLLGVAVGTRRMPPWASGILAGLVSISAVTAIIHATGGPTSPYFVTLACTPLMVAMFTPDSRAPTLGTIAAMSGAVVVLNLLARVPSREFLPQALIFSLIGGLGLYGGRTYRRLRESERLAQEDRLLALEQLAESERKRRRAEAERAEMERRLQLGQLASGVAHGVNNPLAFVKSNLNYLEQELAAVDKPSDIRELRELLGETRQGVLRIQRIVADLRYFSREGATAEEQGSPREAMEEARRRALGHMHSLGEVLLDVPDELPPVRLGQQHLMQVLLNLLLNAAEAVEGTKPRRPALIRLRARRTPSDVRVEVEDNGPGIPSDVLPRLFEPFFTTKAPGRGSGLGLTLCQEYVARVGGSLTAENRPEGGARFVLTLNQAAEPASRS